MNERALRQLAALFVTGLAVGCVFPEKSDEVSATAPVALYPPALTLRGAESDQLYAVADETVAEGTLDAQWIERVARAARPAVVSIYVVTEEKARVRLIPIQIPGYQFL